VANQYIPWTDLELEQLVTEFPLKGATKLSAIMGRTHYAVVAMAQHLGLKYIPKIDRVNFQDVKSLAELGHGVDAIARELGVGHVIVWKVCKRNHFSIKKAHSKIYLTNESNTGKKNFLLRQIQEFGLSEVFDHCCVCGWDKGPIDYAHVIPGRSNGDYTIHNVVPLCPNHHRLFDVGKLMPEELGVIVELQGVVASKEEK